MVKTARINTTSFSYSNIAKNGLVCKPGDLLTLVEGADGQSYVDLAKPSDIIRGVCNDRKTFADDNETNEKGRVNYTPTAWDNTYKMEVSGDVPVKVGKFYLITADQKIDPVSESGTVGQLMVQDINDAYIEVRFVVNQGTSSGTYTDTRLVEVYPTNPESDPFDGQYTFLMSTGLTISGDFSPVCAWLQENLSLSNVEIENLVVKTSLESQGTTTTNGITNTGDITNTGNISNEGDITNIGDISNTGDVTVSGKTTTNSFETNTAVVNNEFTSLGTTTTNGIDNNGDITNSGNITNQGKITTDEVEAESITTDELTIDGPISTKGIVNDGDITNTGNITNGGNVTVNGTTDIQGLEVNGATNFRDEVKIYDDFYVAGDSVMNGDITINGAEEHNGEITYNGDVTFNGKLTADHLDIDMYEYQKRDEKGRPNGYASLDGTGKVPLTQIPNLEGGINYKGPWNAATGIYPPLPENGDMYYCIQAGIVDNIQYNVGDRIIYSSEANRWSTLPDNYGVQSVNGRNGIVVGLEETADRKNVIDLIDPATTKYLSEKAVADIINSLITRIEELEAEQEQFTMPDLSNDLPASMVAGTSYNVPVQGMTADTNIVIGNTNTNGNIVVTPAQGYVTIVSSANETNPVINILTFKPRS